VDLATGLEVADIRPFVDLQSISAAEEWKPRISALIQQCDTVIFVITPAAMNSEILKWEIEEAVAKSKRLMKRVFDHGRPGHGHIAAPLQRSLKRSFDHRATLTTDSYKRHTPTLQNFEAHR
jgi:hypothetical protein